MIYTIGYGGSQPDDFFGCIESNGIELVIDVRTKPRGYLNIYSVPAIGGKLLGMGIDYTHDPRLGGLETINQTEFTSAIEDVINLSRDMRVLLMCSEKDPRKCHRYYKLSPELEASGAEMCHLIVGNNQPFVDPDTKQQQTTLF